MHIGISSNRPLRLAILVVVASAIILFLDAMQPGAPVVLAANGNDLETCGSTNVQFLGQSEALDKTIFGGFPVRELSGITYDKHETYYANADRVGGSEVSRFFTLSIPVHEEGIGEPAVQAVTILERADGSPSTGSDFDGEGIALDYRGDLFIASEGRAGFQTEVRHYNLDGSLIDTLAVPSRFLVPPASGAEGTNNLSFESMTLSPNGRSLYTANETPLTNDGNTSAREGRIRILRYEDRGPAGFAPVGQFYYLMDAARNATGPLEVGVAEIVAVSENELLVLERGFVAGLGNTIRIYQVSMKDAMDISEEPSLAAPGLQPIEKVLLVDLATCPVGGASLPPGAVQPNPLLDNFEAMALGPLLPGGRQTLVLLSDDNGGANQRTRVVALSVRVPLP